MYRITKKEKGYIVERGKKNWLGSITWSCFITYLGSNDPFYYSSFGGAMKALNDEIAYIVLKNSELS